MTPQGLLLVPAIHALTDQFGVHDVIEVMLDAYGLKRIATAVAEVCVVKADRLRPSNEAMANEWHTMGQCIFDTLAASVPPLREAGQ